MLLGRIIKIFKAHIFFTIVLLSFTLIKPVSAFAAPTLTTDKFDYYPWESVTILGSGLLPVHNYTLNITSPDTPPTTSNILITTNVDGGFVEHYTLDGQYRPLYKITLQENGKSIVYTSFTDGIVESLTQCFNYDGDGYKSDDLGCRWSDAALQGKSSAYQEGDSVVQRVVLAGLAPGSIHTLTLNYTTTESGKHAYDYLTTWDYSEKWIDIEDRCQDVKGCVKSPESLFLIPKDPNSAFTVEKVKVPSNSQFVMRGGILKSVTIPTVLNGTYADDSETVVTVNFKVGDANSAMCSFSSGATSCKVALWFGAHIASAGDWGSGVVSTLEDSPYMVSVGALDGSQVSDHSTQMFADAVVPSQKARLTLLKTVVNDNGGNATDSDWTLSAEGSSIISGVEGSESVTNALVNVGEYVLKESDGPTGYLESTYSCSKNNSAPIVGNKLLLNAGDSVICTIVSNDVPPHIIIKTNVINDDGGTKEAGDAAIISGITTLSPVAVKDKQGELDYVLSSIGWYSINENIDDGYNATFSTGCSGTIVLGETKTCIITIDDIPSQLTIIKKLEPNKLSSFSFDSSLGEFTLTSSGSKKFSDISAGIVTVSELTQADSTITCIDGKNNSIYPASISGSTLTLDLSPGSDVACTFLSKIL